MGVEIMKRLGEHRYVAAVSPIRRHLLDPWEAEIVDHSAPPEAAMRFDGVPITSASPSVARLRTRCLILLGSLMKKECPPASLIDELDRSLDQEQDWALFGLPRSSPAGTDRSALPTAAFLKGWRPARLPDGSRGGILYAGRNPKGPAPPSPLPCGLAPETPEMLSSVKSSSGLPATFRSEPADSIPEHSAEQNHDSHPVLLAGRGRQYSGCLCRSAPAKDHPVICGRCPCPAGLGIPGGNAEIRGLGIVSGWRLSAGSPGYSPA